jgi:hypothetical protein
VPPALVIRRSPPGVIRGDAGLAAGASPLPRRRAATVVKRRGARKPLLK